MNTLTIVTLAILLLFILIGWHKGFLRMIFSFGTLALSLVLAVMIAPRAADMLSNSSRINNFINDKYIEYIESKKDSNADTDKETVLDALIKQYSNDNNFDIKKIAETVMNNSTIDNVEQNIEQHSKTAVASGLTAITLKVLGFLITWIIILIIIRILLGIIKVIEKIPIIHGVNKVLGIVTGGVLGLFLIWGLFAIFTVLAATDIGSTCLAQIEESKFLGLIYKYDIFITLISKL